MFRSAAPALFRASGAPALRAALLGVAGIYVVAFASLLVQLGPLLGSKGLTPIAEAVGAYPAGEGFLLAPSLLWFVNSDAILTALACLGLTGSILAVFLSAPIRNPHSGAVSRPALGLLFAGLWAIYLSFVQLGDRWYGYGWETLLLEAGALTAVLAATGSGAILWLYRWLAFRLMFGAGMIKVRGDDCWRDLTCLRYHFETQPIPNPLSWSLHQLPPWILDAGVVWNHVVELIVPWGLFHPRARPVSAWILVLFQAMLIVSGNLAFLNWLTLAICVPVALDRPGTAPPIEGWRRGFTTAWLALVAILSIGPAWNLVSSDQRMNASFDRLHLVNTYGAFGSVGRERLEIVLEGWDGENWLAWEFPFKPGDPDRRPPIIAPFQPRLDWQIWFAAQQPPGRNLWLVHLLYQLLTGQPGPKSLLANDPFPDGPPLRVRADLYRYTFTDTGPDWWDRERQGAYLPAFDLDDPGIQQIAAEQGW